MVEVFAGVAFEADDDAGDHAGRALDGVLPAEFVGSGGSAGAMKRSFLCAMYSKVSKMRRSRTWKRTRWRCMGWVSSVWLTNSQISVELSFGVSVTGSCQCLWLSSMIMGLPTRS